MVHKNIHAGQVALITLLVLTIATTVGLSLVARTTTDISTTRNIEESTRAFSAAEAGIEETLKSGIASPETLVDTGVSYVTTIVPVTGGSSNPFVFPKTLKENTETLWLVNHNADGTINETKYYTQPTINICWSHESPTNTALIVSVLYRKFGGLYQIARVVFDPDSRISNATPSVAGGCTADTAYTGTIDFSTLGINVGAAPTDDILIALRIRPVYSGAQIAVQPAADIPIQGNNIESVGKAGADVNRKIIVYQQYRSPDSVFDYGVYSENSFSQ